MRVSKIQLRFLVVLQICWFASACDRMQSAKPEETATAELSGLASQTPPVVEDPEGAEPRPIPSPEPAIPPAVVEPVRPPVSPTWPLPTQVVVQTLPGRYGWAEGASWISEVSSFAFSDGSKIYLWKPGEASAQLFFQLPRSVNHGTVFSGGWLYFANRGPADVAKLRVADLHFESLDLRMTAGGVLGRPNDLDIFSDGSVYFTDFVANGRDRPANYSGDGVYRRRSDGRVEKVIGDLRLPNGIQFSKDCQWLYVADMGTDQIFRYHVGPTGVLDGKKLFYETNEPGHSVNGLALDENGNVYTSGRSRVTLLSPDGKELGRISVGGLETVNMAFGGRDGRTLFITTPNSVKFVELNIPGGTCAR